MVHQKSKVWAADEKEISREWVLREGSSSSWYHVAQQVNYLRRVLDVSDSMARACSSLE